MVSRGKDTRRVFGITFGTCEGSNIPRLRADVEDYGGLEPWNLRGEKRVKEPRSRAPVGDLP